MKVSSFTAAVVSAAAFSTDVLGKLDHMTMEDMV